jgi:4-hydroxy-4-methyl-2-oxoglutarate aldolase
VHTGDLMIGDVDGVVALPAADVDRVLDRADARAAREAELMDLIRQGRTTLELYSFGAGQRT